MVKSLDKVNIKNFDPALPMSKIVVAEENVRKTHQTAGLEDLMDNISNFGLIHPIVVIPDSGKYKVIVGQRRYLAFKALGKTTIPALIIGDLDKTSQQIISLGENIHRQALPYDDTIQVCETLFTEYKGSKTERIKKISKDLGISFKTVTDYLAARLVPIPVRKLVDEKKISRKLAHRITSSLWPDEEKIIEIANQSSRLTKSELERALNMGVRNPKASTRSLINEAKNPKPLYVLVIHLEPETGRRLEEMANKRSVDAATLVKNQIEKMLSEGG